MTVGRLQPPSEAARERLVDLVARYYRAAGGPPLNRAQSGPRISEWSAAIEETYDGFGHVQRALHGAKQLCEFDHLVTLHLDAGFAEVARWTFTDVGVLQRESTPPCALLLHKELGILSLVKGTVWPGESPRIFTHRTQWWLNALVVDEAPFIAMGASRPGGELWLRPGATSNSVLYRGASYDQLLDGRDVGLLPEALYAGRLEFDDHGIADRLDVLRAASVALVPWVYPAMSDYALGGSTEYVVVDDDPRPPGEFFVDAVDTTGRVLAALPAHVHDALGTITAPRVVRS
jgi:hypothetical protein